MKIIAWIKETVDFMYCIKCPLCFFSSSFSLFLSEFGDGVTVGENFILSMKVKSLWIKWIEMSKKIHYYGGYTLNGIMD